MKKNQIPAITATNFDQAQQWMRKYRLAQYRTGEYLKALAVLPQQGIVAPTDFNIARFIDEKRTKQSARGVMTRLVELGLASQLQETDLGFAYSITDRGEIAYQEMLQLERNWLKLWEKDIEPTPADQRDGYAKLNREKRELKEAHYREVRSLQKANDALRETVTSKDELIEALRLEISRLNSELAYHLQHQTFIPYEEEAVPYPEC